MPFAPENSTSTARPEFLARKAPSLSQLPTPDIMLVPQLLVPGTVTRVLEPSNLFPLNNAPYPRPVAHPSPLPLPLPRATRGFSAPTA